MCVTWCFPLGDKENHVPVLHFAMLAHALALITLIVAPLVLWDLYASQRSPRKAPTALFSTASVMYIALGGLIAYALVYHSYSHPFLLSDNRCVSCGKIAFMIACHRF
jgi:hypothetical protein